jgi:hypothetical protein
LRSAFHYRANYRREALRAATLGWFLIAHGADLNPQLVNRRAAWCVRTILIAEAAERRTPVFAAEDLARMSGDDAVRAIIRRKSSAELDPVTLAELGGFLRRRGYSSNRRAGTWDLPRHLAHFRRTGNAVAVRTALGGTPSYSPVD